MDSFEKVKETIVNFYKKITDSISDKSLLNNVFTIYLMWIIAHYIASNLYAYHCTYKSIYGFIISPLMAVTPYCRGILWVITKGSDTITNMWFLMGTAVSAMVIKYLPNVSSSKKEERTDKVD